MEMGIWFTIISMPAMDRIIKTDPIKKTYEFLTYSFYGEIK
jgi:hypothetical protein